MKSPSVTLQTKVLGGLGLFFLFFVFILAYSNWAFERSASNNSTLQRISQLEIMLQNVGQSAQGYLEVAPRDYESYFRDVTIFHKEIMRDINTMGDMISGLSGDYERFSSVSFLPGILGLGGRDSTLEGTINHIQSEWSDFRKGLASQLGPDENEPRLEWGAQYINREQSMLMAALTDVQQHFQRVMQADLDRTNMLTTLGFIAGIIFAISGVAWFYFGVTRRIRLTVDGCRRVAQGDFGYQLPSAANDELGDLVNAFNSLSARARLVLAVLDRLREGQDKQEAAQILWEECSAALSAEWFALAATSGDNVHLAHVFPENGRNVIRNQDAIGDREQAFTEALKTARPQYFPDLLRHSVANANARFIRDLHKAGYRSALFVPLIGDSDLRCIMVLAAKKANAFTAEQVILLHRIGPMIAHQLEQTADTQNQLNAA